MLRTQVSAAPRSHKGGGVLHASSQRPHASAARAVQAPLSARASLLACSSPADHLRDLGVRARAVYYLHGDARPREVVPLPGQGGAEDCGALPRAGGGLDYAVEGALEAEEGRKGGQMGSHVETNKTGPSNSTSPGDDALRHLPLRLHDLLVRPTYPHAIDGEHRPLVKLGDVARDSDGGVGGGGGAGLDVSDTLHFHREEVLDGDLVAGAGGGGGEGDGDEPGGGGLARRRSIRIRAERAWRPGVCVRVRRRRRRRLRLRRGRRGGLASLLPPELRVGG